MTDDHTKAVSSVKRSILAALRMPPEVSDSGWPQDDAFQSLRGLLDGSVARGEGNTCFVLGSRGCGKTRLVNRVLHEYTDQAIVVRLSGNAQLSDRAAVREMARQISRQTGSNIELEESDNESDTESDPGITTGQGLLPPASQILSLVARLPTLPRPAIVVLDAIDLFTAHARQALLYCLFDTAQSIRAGSSLKGLAVIGVTSRVDTLNLLEKRVKSRFSHRIVRISPPQDFESYISVARSLLSPGTAKLSSEERSWWEDNVDEFLSDHTVSDILEDTYSLSQSVRLLCQVLTPCILELNSTSYKLSPISLQAGFNTQCGPPRFPFLSNLPYPHLGLLIAANHSRSAGHEAFTFEMLHERFETQIRTSSAAPVQLGGVSIGMLKCPRSVMNASFEQLVQLKVFQSAAPTGQSVSREFAKYRCVPDRHDIRFAVEETGQTNLKKWLLKDQT